MAQEPAAATVSPSWRQGILWGSFGMLAFSGTLPATRLAVRSFTPAIITYSRIEIAAVLGLITLLFIGGPSPKRRQWLGILWTGLGLAIGYPFFVALALEQVPASHGAVVVGLTPATTAVMSVLRAGERPPLRFWLGCIAGVVVITAFTMSRAEGGVELADGWLVAAMLSVGFSYVEGGRVARELGGTRTLCWAMIMLAPLVAVPLVIEVRNHAWSPIPLGAWVGFWYTGIVSMFLGSVSWYRGLAMGGIARIGQLNLLVPMLALLWSAVLLREAITPSTVVAAVMVLVAMSVSVRSRVPVR